MSTRPTRVRFALLLPFLLLAPGTAWSRTLHVKSGGIPGLNCDCTTIQTCISTASEGDTVLVDPGVYNEGLSIQIGIHLLSAQGPRTTILDGTSHDHIGVISQPTGPVTLQGFTLRNGNANIHNGGALLIHGGVIRLLDNVFTDNAAWFGGAVYSLSSRSVYLSGNTFTGNRSTVDGGAIAASIFGSLTAVGNVFTNNGATNDGGALVFTSFDTLALEGNTFERNLASHDGGALHFRFSRATVLIARNSFRGNVAAESGGGLSHYDNGSPVLIEENSFVGNSGVWGGGLFFQLVDRRVKVRANKITDNFSQDLAAGLYAWNWADLVIERNLFARNVSTNYGAIHIWQSAPLVVGNTFADNGGNSAAWFSSSRIEPPAVFRANIIAGQPGSALEWFSSSADTVSCNVFWNSGPVICPSCSPDHGDTLDPQFCDSGMPYHLLPASPCNPDQSGGCGLIGAFGTCTAPRYRIAFPRTTAGDTARRRLAITNYRATPVSLGPVSFASDAFALSKGFRDSLSAGVHLEGLAAIRTTLSFTPLRGGRDSLFFAFLSRNGLRDTLATVRLEGVGRPLGHELLSLAFYQDRLIASGQDASFLVQLADSIKADSVRLEYRAGGEETYQGVVMSAVSAESGRGRYVATITKNELSPAGLELRTVAYNGPALAYSPAGGSPYRFRIGFGEVEFPATRSLEYEMVSIPFRPQSSAFREIFGDEFQHDNWQVWRMFSYEPGAGEEDYSELRLGSSPGPELQSGRSFWLITRDPMVLQAAGTSTPTDSACAIVLEPGWNMIGSEFFFPVSWDSVKVATVPLPAAIDAGWVGIPWEYASGSWRESPYLSPFSGVFLQNASDLNLTLRVPPVRLGFPAADKAATRNAPFTGESGSTFRLIAESDGSRRASAQLGWRAGAREGWDPADQMIPPDPPGGSFLVCFPHPEWGAHAGRYLVDLRDGPEPKMPSSTEPASRSPGSGQCWELDIVEAGTSAPGSIAPASVSLRLEPLEMLPRDFAAVLLDLKLGRSVRLQPDSRYRFALTAPPAGKGDHTPRFRLLIGEASFLERRTSDLVPPPAIARLYPASPNPVTSATVLRFDVAAPGWVDLAVFSVDGRTVRLLNHDWMLPGRYEALWDGQAVDGRRAAAGVYFVRLRVSGAERSTQRVTVVK